MPVFRVMSLYREKEQLCYYAVLVQLRIVLGRGTDQLGEELISASVHFPPSSHVISPEGQFCAFWKLPNNSTLCSLFYTRCRGCQPMAWTVISPLWLPVLWMLSFSPTKIFRQVLAFCSVEMLLMRVIGTHGRLF